MNSNLGLVSLVLVLACISCIGSCSPREIPAEYEVYSDFIDEMNWQRSGQTGGGRIRRIVIADSTDWKGILSSERQPWIINEYEKRRLPDLEPSTIASFESRNRVPSRLVAEYFTRHRVELVDKEELNKRATRGGFWVYFYDRFPFSQGLLCLSQVGINEDGTQALMAYSIHVMELHGEAALVILYKVDGKWRIGPRESLWIS